MQKHLAATFLLFLPFSALGAAHVTMSLCDIFALGKRLHGSTIELSAVFVTGPGVPSLLTDSRCPEVLIPIGYAREPETESVTAAFIKATSNPTRNAAFRIEATGLFLWSHGSRPFIELDRVHTFQEDLQFHGP